MSAPQVPRIPREPRSTYDISEDEWAGETLGLFNVNHGYYGETASDPKIPRWVAGTPLERADAQRLDELRCEVSHAVLNYYSETREGLHPLARWLFAERAGEPHLRLTATPNPDGSFDIAPYDIDSPWHATVRAGEIPRWERRTQPPRDEP
jgi:hypothetical protein